MKKVKITAIILAAGKGKRMGTQVSKQYLLLKEKPVLFYTISAFEQSIVDEVILVTGEGEEDYCRTEIVEKFSFKKVSKIVAGGKERYDSVYQGLLAVNSADVVLIHDGARPFIDADTIKRAAESAMKYKTGVVGVKVKDTIKMVNSENEVLETPDRSKLWQVQTPQAFAYQDIRNAYEYVLKKKIPNITDDAMVWECYSNIPVKIVDGSYFNIKITTKEDMIFGEAILGN